MVPFFIHSDTNWLSEIQTQDPLHGVPTLYHLSYLPCLQSEVPSVCVFDVGGVGGGVKGEI